MNPSPFASARLTHALQFGALITALAASPVASRAQTAPKPSTPSPSAAQADEVIQLSPFEVNSSSQGYFSANTTSGTRLNSKIEDLGTSITVVTKEQMADFALLDINDIFNYEASTEGTGTFSAREYDQNGFETDNVQLTPERANRVRGLNAANITFGNFETSGAILIDPLNIDGVEISRGPNSSLFGMGTGGGTVNSVPSSANLLRNRSQVSARGDSLGGYRTTLDLNRVLIPKVLAVRGSVSYHHDAFKLKPSGVDTVRLNGMAKYRPFKNTTLSGSISTYRSHGNRPNTGTPPDAITGWIEAGKPTWDPSTRTSISIFTRRIARGCSPIVSPPRFSSMRAT